MESFGIVINNQDIKQAFLRPNKKSGALVAVVEFFDLESKIRVLQEKRKANNDRKIYFNHCLTPHNRYLMAKARAVAKEKNFRVFINGDQIHVKKDEHTKLTINDDCDIETIKSWIPNLRTNIAASNESQVVPTTSQSNL